MARTSLRDSLVNNTQGGVSPSVPTLPKSSLEKKKTLMTKLLSKGFNLTDLEDKNNEIEHDSRSNTNRALNSEAIPTPQYHNANLTMLGTTRFTTSEYSWPIILVIFPPIISTFYGDAQTWSDILLLVLVGFYLFLIIKVPWELYFVARKRKLNMISLATTPPQPGNARQEALRFEAEKKLRRQEKLAFFIVLISPMLGGSMLYIVKSYLSQFDKYFSQLNIMIFIFATGIKPITFLIGLLKKRALMLQEEIHYPVGEVEGLRRRVGFLENELNQLRKAYATKLEMDQVQDGVEPTLIQFSRLLQRYNKRVQRIRAQGEERLTMLEMKLNELEHGDLSSDSVNLENKSNSSLPGFLLTGFSTLVFLPMNVAANSLKLMRYFLPNSLQPASSGKSTPLIQSLGRHSN